MVKSFMLIVAVAATVMLSSSRAVAEGENPPMGWGLRADPEGQDYLNLKMQPGETFEGSLFLINATSEPLTLEVRKVKALTAQLGGLALGDVGEGGVMDWVTYNGDTYEVAQHSTEQIHFTLLIPDDATPFEHVFGFVAQLPDESLTSFGNGLGIKIRERSGVPVILTVGSPTRCELTLTKFESYYRSTSWLGILRFHVSGDVHFKGSGSLELHRPGSRKPVQIFNIRIAWSAAGLPIIYPIYATDLQPGRYELSGSIFSSEVEGCELEIEEEMRITPKEYDRAEIERAEVEAAEILAFNSTGDNASNMPPNVVAGLAIMGMTGIVAAMLSGVIALTVRASNRKRRRR